MTKVARDAAVARVDVDRRPAEETLPDGVRFVGSDELQARNAGNGGARPIDKLSGERRRHGLGVITTASGLAFTGK